MTIAVSTEQAITQKSQNHTDREGVMLVLWLFRAMKLEKKNCKREERKGEDFLSCEDEKRFKLQSQCAYNTAWQRVKSPISTYYWPTSPVSSSFILTSWAHLSFPVEENVVNRALGWDSHTQKYTPNFGHGSWGLMSSSTTDKEWLSLCLHWVYSDSTMKPKGQPLACPVWRHRSKYV